MTTNSINYNKHLEDKRANVARENETQRANLAQEAETKRHNLATEEIAQANLQELIRHQTVSEQLSLEQMLNALSVAQIGAQGRVSSAAIGAAASRYASDNAFASNMASVAQRQYATEIGALTSKYTADMQASTSRDVASMNNAWNSYNVSRQIRSNESINSANVAQRERESIRNQEQRERESKRTNLVNLINGQSSAASNLAGSALKFLPLGGI